MRRNLLLTIAVLAGLLGAWEIMARATGRNPAGDSFSYNEAVPIGTHFLVRTDDELSTSRDRLNQKFEARTLDPLQSTGGHVIVSGARVSGHISKIEPAAATGRARIWLTFDDIDTRYGRLPVIAEVSGVPGDFSVKAGESKEGEIEARTSDSSRDFQAAAAGAALGAAAAAPHGAKSAAFGALAGGVTGFLVSSGFSQELDLPKGTKLDLVLDRPLYLSN